MAGRASFSQPCAALCVAEPPDEGVDGPGRVVPPETRRVVRVDGHAHGLIASGERGLGRQ